jgi:hypothetical protein
MGGMTRPTPFLLLLAVCSALALAACGSSENDNASAGSKEDKAFEGALKFAQCMREHGVDMPDPQRGNGGGILLKSGKRGPKKGEKGTTGGPSTDGGPGADPKFRTAEQACRKYLQRGGGKAPSPAEQARQRDAFVNYARCMRGKGINMPDPKFSGNGIQMALGPGNDPESPRFKAADQKCHPLLAAVEPKGAAGPSSAVAR